MRLNTTQKNKSSSMSKIGFTCWAILAFLLNGLGWGHVADPAGILVKYSLYGKDLFKIPGNGITATGGWIGSDTKCWISGPNQATISGVTRCKGELLYEGWGSPGGGGSAIFKDSVFVDGNIKYGVALYEKPVRYSGSLIGSGSNTFNSTNVNAAVSITTPIFPTGVTSQANSTNITSCGTALNPGNYGDIAINCALTLNSGDSGVYHFKSITLNNGGKITINKTTDKVVRLIVNNGINLIASTSIQTSVANDFGKVLIYQIGTSDITINSSTRIDASIVAPNANINIDHSVELNGQALSGKELKISNWNFNGNDGKFVSFDPAVITIASNQLLGISENSDVTNTNTKNNTRRVALDVSLSVAAAGGFRVPYCFDTSATNPATFGITTDTVSTFADTTGKDVVVHQNLVCPNNGTTPTNYLVFDSLATLPSGYIPTFLINDDGKAESNENFAVKLFAPINKTDLNPSTIAVIENADGSGNRTYDIPITSDDAANQAPTAVNDSINVNEGATASVLVSGATNLKTNDNDETISTATVSYINGTTGVRALANGSFTLNSDGTFSYTHNGTETLKDSVQYILTDDVGLKDTAWIKIGINPVNDVPVIVSDSINVNENATATAFVTGVNSLNNLVTDDNTTFTYSVLTQGVNGVFTVNNQTTGAFTYTQNGSETTKDSVRIVVSDASNAKDTVWIKVGINPINDIPVIVSDSINVNEGATKTSFVSTKTSLNLLVTDLDNASWTYNVLQQGANGTFTVTNQTTGTFSYAHNGSETLKDSVKIEVVDASNAKDTVWIKVGINPVNDVPVIVSDSINVNENGVATSFTSGKNSLNQLVTDDNNSFTYTVLTQGVNGTFAIVNQNAGTFTYTHLGSESAKDSVQIVVADASSTKDTVWIKIGINPINDVPVIVSDSINVNEGATKTSFVSAKTSLNQLVTDLDNTSWTYNVLQQGAHGTFTVTNQTTGTFSYTHNGLESTKDSVKIEVVDATNAKDSVWIKVGINPVNDKPDLLSDTIAVAEGDTATSFLSGKTKLQDLNQDPDGPTSTFNVLTNGVNGTLTITNTSTGTFSYIHNGTSTIADSIKVRVTDGTLADTVMVYVKVTAVNDPAVIVADTILVNEGDSSFVFKSGKNSLNQITSDQDGDVVSFSVVTNGVNGTFSITNASNNFKYVHNGSETLKDSIRISGNDGKVSTLQWLYVVVTSQNDNPTGLSLSGSQTLDENKAKGTFVGAFTSTDIDNNSGFTYSLVGGVGSTDNAKFTIVNDSLRSNYIFNYELASEKSATIRVRTTDANGGTFEKSYVININNVNEDPLTIALSADSIQEGQVIGTSIGIFSSTDTDSSDTHTFTLVGGDSAAFKIKNGNELVSDSVFNFNAKKVYTILVKSTDAGGLDTVYSKTIKITNKNDAPTDIQLSNNTVVENTTLGVGHFSTTDADNVSGDTHTYTLSGTDANSFNIINQDSLVFKTLPDFEVKSSYQITVTTTDALGLTYNKNFVIYVTNQNENPTDIVLSADTISENKGVNQFVGKLSTIDTDTANTFTYGLVSGVGATDNSSFTVRNDSLFINVSANFEAQNSYSIRVRSADQGSLNFEKVFVVHINNVNETPYILNLSSTNVAEKTSASTQIATMSTTDYDNTDTWSYQFVNDVNGVDNSKFAISGDKLIIQVVPDVNVQASYQIHLKTTDAAGLFKDSVFTITVNNVNDYPTDIYLTDSTILDGDTVGLFIGKLKTIDKDAGDTFTYLLVSGDTSWVRLSNDSLFLKKQADFETDSILTIKVRSTDNGTLPVEVDLNIHVQNVNESPTQITLNPTSIFENIGNGAYVGKFSTLDPDLNNTFAYSLVNGSSDADNAKFTVRQDSLFIVQNPDYEIQKTYSIRVRSTDQGNLFTEEIFNITVKDINENPYQVSQLKLDTLIEDFADTVLTRHLSDVFKDPEGDTLSFSVSTHGIVAAYPLGDVLVVKSSPNDNGADTITITVTDKQAKSLIVRVPVFVFPVNDVPTAVNTQVVTVNEDAGAQTISNWANNLISVTPPANEASQAALSMRILNVDKPSLFTVQPVASNLKDLSFTSALNKHDTATLFALVKDNGGTAFGGVDSVVVSFKIVVKPVNDKVQTLADVYNIKEDSVLSVTGRGVLTNDNDTADGDTAKVFIAKLGAQAKHGVVVLDSLGSFTYTPNKDFFGADTFSYYAVDKTPAGTLDSSVATQVVINLSAVIDTAIVKGGTFKVAEDTVTGNGRIVGFITLIEPFGEKGTNTLSLVNNPYLELGNNVVGKDTILTPNGESATRTYYEVVVKSGVTLDFEDKAFTTKTLPDGSTVVEYNVNAISTNKVLASYKDTANVTLQLTNVNEKSNLVIDLIAKKDSSSVTVIKTGSQIQNPTDTVWVNSDSVKVTYKQDGKDTTITYSVTVGAKTDIIRIWTASNKDVPDTTHLVVYSSKTIPEFVLNDTTKGGTIGRDSTGKVIDVFNVVKDTTGKELVYVRDPNTKLDFIIKEVGSQLEQILRNDTSTIGTTNPGHVTFENVILKEGDTTAIKLSYTDKYGNKKDTTIYVILDTKVPVVVINSPKLGDKFDYLLVDVNYTVDGQKCVDWLGDNHGISCNKAEKQSLVNGKNVIVREAIDFAGNVGRADVTVYAAQGSGDINLSFTELVVNTNSQGMTNAQNTYKDLNLVQDPNDNYILLVEDAKNPGNYIKVLMGSNGQVQTFQDESSTAISKNTGLPMLNIDVTFPSNGGLNALGENRAGVCTIPGKSDIPMYALSIESIQILTYDQIGQFIEKFGFGAESRKVYTTKKEISTILNDLGKTRFAMLMAMPGGVRKNKEGTAWGSGLNIYNINVVTKATPNPLCFGADLKAVPADVRTIISKKTTVLKQGFVRGN